MLLLLLLFPVAALAASIAPLDSRNTSRDPAASLQRLSIAELRKFSDSSSCLLLSLPFLPEGDFSLAVAAVAVGFFCFSDSSRSCPVDVICSKLFRLAAALSPARHTLLVQAAEKRIYIYIYVFLCAYICFFFFAYISTVVSASCAKICL